MQNEMTYLFSLQMIHAATTQVECTYNVCGGKMVVFCLYDDRANQPVYDTGEMCKKPKDCTTYRNSMYEKGLCVKPYEAPGRYECALQ
ncbi:hypothetical protein ANCDUO_02210 [Ancylostoma duodenale]|uniref:SCP domain-containing protein n=1 Tax=Ancylostoma duodenale TaxID=51022 RepID=A0A0C2DC89_9BILA|nr:hypothetical protein ANCDUO_02210 [Ancylostoma duodenale]